MKAYALTVSGDWAVPTLYGTGTGVAAGAPVMLVSESGAASVTATIGNVAPPDLINELQGSFFASTPSAYVLNAVDGVVGFYPLASGSTLSANRAYLSKATEVKGFALNWDGADGISEVQGAERMVNGSVYNLAGQRLSQPQRGINIVNGKKVVVK